MQREELRGVLSQVERGQLSVEEAVSKLGAFPTALDLGHSTIDTAREARCGCPEVVYGAGKTPQELLEISRSVLEHHKRLLPYLYMGAITAANDATLRNRNKGWC